MEKIWIDAAAFDNYGGFVLETQFVREMGQSYLMANGTGIAVAPASVTFKVNEGGSYRFYIRTKNWCEEHAPDGLILEVDGKRSEHISSKMHIKDWYFEIGADFALEKGEHILKVYDTTGWFGRFACVVVTNDYDFVPSRELKALKKQRSAIKGEAETVKELRGYDLVVVGGGVGGIVTAITAARYGLKVALINDRPILGGNASEEANVALEGAAHRGYHEMGVVLEIKNYREAYKTSFSEAFSYFVSREKNIDLFSNTLLTDAVTEGDEIKEILTVNTLDLSECRFFADRFADATGDGWLGYYAGASYRVGREARFEHGESFAPTVSDGRTMSGCNTGSDPLGKHETICGYFASERAEDVSFTAPSWAFRLPEGDALSRTPDKLHKGAWWLELPTDYDDLFESEFVRDSMIRLTVGYFGWLKNSWTGREKASRLALDKVCTYNAKRESRRLIGDYILTENDYVEGKTHFDAVGYTGWEIDIHHDKGIFSGSEGEYFAGKKIPISEIPFGTLYSKNIKNLFLTGRCISATHVGLGASRVQMTAGALGQAVAIAAYLCKKYGVTPREIRNGHINELQQLLLKDGLYIPNVKNHDEGDLARGATVSATSHTVGGEPINVINGKVWRNDGEDYAWVSSEALPQSIMLKWGEPKTVKEVRVTFDMPFEKYKYGYMEQPVPEAIATDFSVSLLTSGNWTEVKTVTGNIQRLVVLDIDPTVAEGVKITVTKTVNTPCAIIPEIRIY